jgi:hypothetical protein
MCDKLPEGTLLRVTILTMKSLETCISQVRASLSPVRLSLPVLFGAFASPYPRTLSPIPAERAHTVHTWPIKLWRTPHECLKSSCGARRMNVFNQAVAHAA